MEDISGLPDFWVAHPDAEAVEVFRTLKSKRDNSGAILYFIKFMNDPSHEIVRRMKPEDRADELKKWLGIEEKDLKNSKGQQFKIVTDCEEWFKHNWLEPTARLLNAHAAKVFQAAAVVEKFPIDTLDQMGEYAKGLEIFHIIKDTYDKAQALFKTQDTTKKKHGGGPVSMADSNEIFEDLE